MSNILIAGFLAASLFTLGLNAQTVTLTASPASSTFSYMIGAATLPAAQTISIKAGTATPTFTTSVTGINSQWLTVSPDSGKVPGNLSLRVNPTTLSVGQYLASVVITAPTATLSIVVTLNVTSPPSTLTLGATTLMFAAPPSPVPPQTVQLSTSGTPISFTVTSGATWMTVTPSVGVVLPGEQEILTIAVDPTTLAPQVAPYTAKVTIVQSGTGSAAKSQSITVTFVVNSSTPTITTIWPATLPIGAPAQTITIRGTNFYAATVASVQGFPATLTTTVLSPSALLAVVPAADLIAAAVLNVIVTNPAPGGSSTSIPLTVANVPSISAVTNVASYSSLSISPGELVTIFGTNIGPAVPVAMSITNGFVDTTLGGVSISVDNQIAPLLYVSANQVTLQVPYEVTQGAGIQISLTNGLNPPATSTVTVAPAAPGVFTADGTGVNQAAALNFNATTTLYTLNTGANPAHPGDIVIIYLTGEGDFNPALSPRTGLIVPATLSPLPQLSPLPTVTIGGAAATVQYAGPLVGSILGLLQINCVVPAAATTGQAVPVIVTIGGVNSQASTTLSLHP